jgi:predicted MPP superfamily phosphohydrolase
MLLRGLNKKLGYLPLSVRLETLSSHCAFFAPAQAIDLEPADPRNVACEVEPKSPDLVVLGNHAVDRQRMSSERTSIKRFSGRNKLTAIASSRNHKFGEASNCLVFTEKTIQRNKQQQKIPKTKKAEIIGALAINRLDQTVCLA